MSKKSQIIFFLDRALGKNKVANALRNAGETVEIHDDHFPKNAFDNDWIPIVAKKGWVILTADLKIRYRKLEMLAVEHSKAKLFVLVSGNLSGDEMASAFVKAIKSIKRIAANQKGPFIAKVYKNGSVKLWK